jgi:glycosyltransferase involved in cell wall biosynthesis
MCRFPASNRIESSLDDKRSSGCFRTDFAGGFVSQDTRKHGQWNEGAGRGYVLVTAARNEEQFIERAISSVVAQTVLPDRWIIASDGSVDGTERIVEEYSKRFEFVELLCVKNTLGRSFASKVYAVHAAMEKLTGVNYAFIGNLDADVSLENTYFAELLLEFERNPELGLAGGYIHEKRCEKFTVRPGNSVRSVAGAVQMFRRECYESVGGLLPLKHGGEDWCAEVLARMNGWHVEAFPKLRVFHHKATGKGVGILKYWYRQGFMDFSLGTHPVFAAVKCVRRLRCRPYFAAAMARLAGFVWAHHRSEERPVSREFVDYLRSEQKERMLALVQHPIRRLLPRVNQGFRV